MNRTRRALLVLGTSVVAVVAAALPAQAQFSASRALPATSVTSLTVAPPTQVRVDTSCITTTTTIKRTYERNPYTGATWQVAYSQSSSTASSRTNVESDTTTTASGPGVNQYTTTQTIKDTEMFATLRWSPSTTTRGVSGYRMTAFLNNGWSVDMGDAAATDTSMTGQYDASVVNYAAQLSMVTLTSYGWTATSALSNPVRC
ncbi:hypothetical protein [Blastococcus sp. SYSU D00820]